MSVDDMQMDDMILVSIDDHAINVPPPVHTAPI